MKTASELWFSMAPPPPPQPRGRGGVNPQAPEGPPPMTFFITTILIFGIFYFLLIRPQQKQKKEQEKLIASLETGDRVITSGGILGVVTNVKEKTVVIRVAENVKIEVLKSALTTVTKTVKEESKDVAKESKEAKGKS
ncbi:preprotein translocase subunit YajC [Methylacidiphilum caldifontis]|uniref:Sec translocon accessory complex subunit YajC n=1 Tax=Methylacidiphilum caldifontis TaxID=2795386 RepID=A0A4Y8PA86_9BACT|nr:preprotein translocase subunit YajC [Methylacidiphilum caldifontis]TFE67705.1 preprotein translocase subunit YajC [Methylacidiphilum caldifontis]